MNAFKVTSGTVTGTSHTNSMRNNQDAYTMQRNTQIAIGVIADGCSAGKHSEVGAHLGANIVAQRLEYYALRVGKQIDYTSFDFTESAVTFPYWEAIRQDTIAQLRMLATSMGESLSQTVNEYFLFTITGFTIAPFGTYIFTIGDGVYALNNEVTIVGPFPGNEPPYLGYGLVGSSIDAKLLSFDVPVQVPTSSVESLAIGSDGVSDFMTIADKNLPGKEVLVGKLSQFWTDDLAGTH